MPAGTLPWRAVLFILGCAAILLVAAYHSTAISIAQQWSNSAYSQGVLVVPLSLYLAWRRRHRLLSVDPNPSFWTLIALGALSFVWLLGVLTSTAVVQHSCLVVMMILLIWGELGTRAGHVLAIPLVFLLFAIPMGDSLIPILQDFSAWFAIKFLDLTRVPALLEGRIITIPGGRWEVAEACSGIHYFLATLTIGFVYADIVYQKWWRRVAFLAASALTAVLANGLRVYGIILTDYLGGTRIARSADHVLAGGVFLSIITILLFALGMRWREETPQETSGQRTGPLPTGNKVAPSLSRFVLFSVLALLVASAAPLTGKFLNDRPMPASSGFLLPRVAAPWTPAGVDLFGWRPKVLAPDLEFVQAYQRQNRVVALYVAYYAPGATNAKVASSSNVLFDKAHWQRTGEGLVEATIDGYPVRIHGTSVKSARTSLILWNWYSIDGKVTSNEFEAKWLLAKSRLTRNHLGSAMIVTATEEQLGGPSATEVLGDFVKNLSFSASPLSAKPNDSSSSLLR